MSNAQPLNNYVAGTWTPSSHGEQRPVHDPATAEVIATVTLTPAEEVARAVEAAHEAQRAWRDTPVVERTQPLFRFKALLEEHIEEIGRIIVRESGKTLPEAVGELRRGIENDAGLGTERNPPGFGSWQKEGHVDIRQIQQIEHRATCRQHLTRLGNAVLHPGRAGRPQGGIVDIGANALDGRLGGPHGGTRGHHIGPCRGQGCLH